MPCTNLAYAPRFAASGLKPPKSISADQVGVEIQAFPAYPTPPKPRLCQQWATNRQWVPPPPFSSRGLRRWFAPTRTSSPPFRGGLPPPPIPSAAPATEVATPTTC